MDFEIDQARFLAALALAQTVADKRSTMPVLANVLLRAQTEGDEPHILTAATDMVISLVERVPAQVKKAGALTLGVRHLHGVLRTLPEGTVRIQAMDNHWAHIVSGKSEFKLMGLPENDFPELPSSNGVKFVQVPGQGLADLIQRTHFSVSTDEARVNLNGVLMESDGKDATMVSTDGHRLTKYTRPLPGPKLGKGIMIPRKGMLEIKRVLDRCDGEVGFAATDQHLFLQADDVTLTVKLSNVAFPPYKQVIPSSHQRRVVAQREVLLAALRQAEVMAPEKTATVRFQLDAGKLELTADNPDLGVAHQEIEVEYDGDPLVAGFNARYLIDVLEAMGTQSIYLEFQGELDPCVLRPVDGPDYLGVVMPMRI